MAETQLLRLSIFPSERKWKDTALLQEWRGCGRGGGRSCSPGAADSDTDMAALGLGAASFLAPACVLE